VLVHNRCVTYGHTASRFQTVYPMRYIFVEPSTKFLPLEATTRFHLLFPGIRNMTTMRTCLVGSDTSTNLRKVLHLYYLVT
jgi:hypothetical protein